MCDCSKSPDPERVQAELAWNAAAVPERSRAEKAQTALRLAEADVQHAAKAIAVLEEGLKRAKGEWRAAVRRRDHAAMHPDLSKGDPAEASPDA